MPSPQTAETQPGSPAQSLIELALKIVNRVLDDAEWGAPADVARLAVHVQSEAAELRVKCSLCARAAVIACFSCHRIYCSHCYIDYHDAAGQEVQ